MCILKIGPGVMKIRLGMVINIRRNARRLLRPTCSVMITLDIRTMAIRMVIEPGGFIPSMIIPGNVEKYAKGINAV